MATKKVLKRFRSTNTIYEDYSIDIAPFAQTGESSQTDVVESSGGKMFLNPYCNCVTSTPLNNL
jgi:hypothetical protein